MSERNEHEEFERLLSSRSGFGDGELGKLAVLARALEANRPKGQAAGPRPEFRAALRSKLLVQARTEAVVIPLSLGARLRATVAARNVGMRRNFRVVFATAAAALMLLVSGAALAAAPGAKPGDGLYWLDRAKEKAELTATFGAVNKAQRHLSFARERLEEVRALADAGEEESSYYLEALQAMDDSTRTGSTILIETFRDGGDGSVLASLVRFTLAQRQELESVAAVVPPGAQPKVLGSIDLVAAVQDRVSDVLGGCPCPSDVLAPATGGSPQVPGTPACSCEPKASSGGQETKKQAKGDGGTKSDDPGTNGKGHDGGGDEEPEPNDDPLPPITGTGIEEQVNDIVDGLLGQLLPSPTPLPGL